MRQRALVDVDLLLDTRYGTIKRIDETIADTLVGSNLYRQRHHDNFDLLTNGLIDRAVYKDLYAKRDEETLYHSRMTDFVYHLRQDVLHGLENKDRGVLIEDLEVDINLYPYDLADESAETIRRAVAHYLPAPVNVNVVRLSPEALNPTYVDNSYEMLAYYNHEDWLIPHQEALIKHPLPTTVMITPMISTSGVVPAPTQEIRDPFLCRSAILVKFLALQYVEAEKACYNPLVREEIIRARTQSSEGT